MESPESNRRPFRGKLEPSTVADSSKAGTLLSLNEYPNAVVRLSYVDVSTKERVAKVVAKINENRNLFSSLEKDGMRVAHTAYVIGEEKNEQGFAESYALVEKIEGKNLSQIDRVDTRMTQEIDQCYAGYLSHLQRIFREGGHYWPDMKMANIVYGTRAGDNVPHTYVVDVGPGSVTLVNENERNNNSSVAASEAWKLTRKLKTVFLEIAWIEKKMEGSVRLEMARAKLQALLTMISPTVDAVGSEDTKNSFSILQKDIERSSDFRT
ncbi:MAG: hypothetical protein Q7S05_01850 [bacterium]|nr:hypothetical protein [bacterium]